MTKNKNNEVTIRSSAAEYLNYVASVGEETHNVEVRYEDENIWLNSKDEGITFWCGISYDKLSY